MLRVRTSHLLRVHDSGTGRSALPGALRQAAGNPEGDRAGSARRHGRRLAACQLRDDGADCDQRRRVPRRARRRRKPRNRHRQLDLRAWLAVRVGRLRPRGDRDRARRCADRRLEPGRRRPRRVVAHGDRRLPALRAVPPRHQHVLALLRGHAARADHRPLALRPPVPRLGYRGLGGRARISARTRSPSARRARSSGSSARSSCSSGAATSRPVVRSPR